MPAIVCENLEKFRLSAIIAEGGPVDEVRAVLASGGIQNRERHGTEALQIVQPLLQSRWVVPAPPSSLRVGGRLIDRCDCDREPVGRTMLVGSHVRLLGNLRLVCQRLFDRSLRCLSKVSEGSRA